ncbi:MAG: radical SAM protein [Schaedlerella sp.]|nr:radical SAM protein [Schaedlerella sp.]
MQNKWKEVKLKNVEKIQSYRRSEDGRVDFYPRYIQLEHTNRCNAQCIMCNHFYLENKGASDISEEIIQKVEPVLPYCQVLMLNGDGEPFLCKNIENYIELYRKYGVRVSTNTNFGHIPEKLWSLFEDGFDLLNISCDGAKKKTFEYIRKGLDFDRFCNNLDRLNETAPVLRKHLDCVVMRQNIQEVTEIVDFAKERGFEKVKFHMLGVNPCIGNQRDSAREFLNLAVYHMSLAKEEAEKIGIAIEVPEELNRLDLLQIPQNEFDDGMSLDREEKKRHVQKYFGDQSLNCDYLKNKASQEMVENASFCAGKICQWAVERCYIDLNGNVTTCCYNTRYHFGNLKEQSFEEIWNGELYRAFRRSMAEGRLPYWCRECNWLRE